LSVKTAKKLWRRYLVDYIVSQEKLPPYLILTLNRFTYSVELKKKLKLTYKVEIADTIEL
jgi:ubiquitin C-terminal hydrolase